jgi:hypothetical protein
MLDPLQSRRSRSKHGLALGLVLLLGIVVLVIGMSMIAISGGLLTSSVDSKQKIKSRMAAESQANMQMAAAVEQATLVFGGEISLPGTPMSDLPTGDGSKASAEIEPIGVNGGILPQERITSGGFKGMMGLKVAFKVHSLGVAPGGAKTAIDAEVKMYQVPIFQFGVFYEGNLEICPGQTMIVQGPVHTNSSAFFRSPGSSGSEVGFQGPITASGSIFHWTMGSGLLWYRLIPEESAVYSLAFPTLRYDMTEMKTFPAFRGEANVRWGVERLNMPIAGATPRSILLPSSPLDPPALNRQKFDTRIGKNPGANRWVNGVTPRPAWITGPKVFFDRRERAWVKFWDFSVKDITSSDSIFYLADTTAMMADRGNAKKRVINAFRIINAAKLPRNMTIATPNPVYLLGDFNAPDPTSTCGPAGVANPITAERYCNALIASDAFTLVSSNWQANDFAHKAMQGTLERDSADVHWTQFKGMGGADSLFEMEPVNGSAGVGPARTAVINAAIMTGNKPSIPAALPPRNYSNGVFENLYEGGWHNTIRFLENLDKDTVRFKGSFVCMWSAASPGLDTGAGKVIRPGSGGYYFPPVRLWSFDPRFTSLANMPPATPFLTTPPTYSFSELR